MKMVNRLPYFACGKVVQGFGRGSKTLGTPTANLQQDVVDQLPPDFNTGIYFGWAKVDDGLVYPQVTSVGWNPYFKNQVKSMESHILQEFEEDFYGSTLKICLVGYIRDELDFTTIDDLKKAIQNDIETSKRELAKPEHASYQNDPFFSKTNGLANGNATNGHA